MVIITIATKIITSPITRNDFRTVLTSVIFENNVFFISIPISSVISTAYGCRDLFFVIHGEYLFPKVISFHDLSRLSFVSNSFQGENAKDGQEKYLLGMRNCTSIKSLSVTWLCTSSVQTTGRMVISLMLLTILSRGSVQDCGCGAIVAMDMDRKIIVISEGEKKEETREKQEKDELQDEASFAVSVSVTLRN